MAYKGPHLATIPTVAVIRDTSRSPGFPQAAGGTLHGSTCHHYCTERRNKKHKNHTQQPTQREQTIPLHPSPFPQTPRQRLAFALNTALKTLEPKTHLPSTQLFTSIQPLAPTRPLSIGHSAIPRLLFICCSLAYLVAKRR